MKIQIPGITIELVPDDVANMKAVLGVETDAELRARLKRLGRAEAEHAIDQRIRQIFKDGGMG